TLALVEGIQLVFFVGGMDAVVLKPEADEQRFHAQHVLEVADNRDRSAHGDQHGGLRPFVAQGSLGLGQKRRVIGQLDGGRAAMLMELHRAVGRDALAYKGAEGFADLGGVLLVHEAERHFRR
ncbi:hypothetical protein BLX88_10505, partial [Bacillus obstructivus]